MNDKDQLPRLGNTPSDILTSLLKSTTGVVPYVGSLIAEIVGNVIPNQRVDRIVRFVEILERRLGNLEQESLRSKLLAPPVVDILEDAFTQAARATTEERVEHIASVVANGVSAEELNEGETKRMLWLLGQLNDSQIVILRGKLATTREEMVSDAEFRQKHEPLLAPDVTNLGSTEDEHEVAALIASYRQHLFELGLVRPRFSQTRKGQIPEFDQRTGMVKASGADVTRLGKMLLRYVNLIPPWYRS